MRKNFAVLAVISRSPCGGGQEYPKMETSGYTYVRANSATNVPAFSANGGGASSLTTSTRCSAPWRTWAVHNGLTSAASTTRR